MNIINIILSTAKDANIPITYLDVQTYLGILKMKNYLPDTEMVYWAYGLKEKESYEHFLFYGSNAIDIDFEFENRKKYKYTEERIPMIYSLMNYTSENLYSYVQQKSGWLDYKEEILQGKEIKY